MSIWMTLGCSAAFVGCALFFLSRRSTPQRQPYNLAHGRLNLQLPPQSMWMNMGFWHRKEDRKQASTLPEACQALLYQVFVTAGLIGESATKQEINLLDVGFGCGDQIVEMFTGVDFGKIHIKNYVGITSSKQQFRYAHTRLQRLDLIGDCTSQRGPSKVEIFGEDAAVPERWSPALRRSVDAMPRHNVWLLGLDSLYHLSPSRLPLYKDAFGRLGASIMAFELLLTRDFDVLPFLTKLLLRFVCIVTGVPPRNLMTESEYQGMLSKLGYKVENIHLVDISEAVFGPLADFLDAQEHELKAIGLGLGALRPAKSVFRWWAISGIVRGYIIVATRE